MTTTTATIFSLRDAFQKYPQNTDLKKLVQKYQVKPFDLKKITIAFIGVALIASSVALFVLGQGAGDLRLIGGLAATGGLISLLNIYFMIRAASLQKQYISDLKNRPQLKAKVDEALSPVDETLASIEESIEEEAGVADDLAQPADEASVHSPHPQTPKSSTPAKDPVAMSTGLKTPQSNPMVSPVRSAPPSTRKKVLSKQSQPIQSQPTGILRLLTPGKGGMIFDFGIAVVRGIVSVWG